VYFVTFSPVLNWEILQSFIFFQIKLYQYFCQFMVSRHSKNYIKTVTDIKSTKSKLSQILSLSVRKSIGFKWYFNLLNCLTELLLRLLIILGIDIYYVIIVITSSEFSLPTSPRHFRFISQRSRNHFNFSHFFPSTELSGSYFNRFILTSQRETISEMSEQSDSHVQR
jgi:hypothetical protein